MSSSIKAAVALLITAVAVIAGARMVCATDEHMAKMYVFAHEDDEMNVAIRIVTQLRNGNEIYCVWVTDGSKGGAAADVRQKESQEVMDLLGVPRDHLFFLGYHDQEAYQHLDEIISDLSGIAQKIRPDEIMSHAYEGGHIDHDVVSFVSTQVAAEIGIVHYEFPDSNMVGGQTRINEFLPDNRSPVQYTPYTDELFSLKMKLYNMYPSQKKSTSYSMLYLDKRKMRKKGEPFRVAPAYDYSRPAAEELRYGLTSKGNASYGEWAEAYGKFIEKHKSPTK